MIKRIRLLSQSILNKILFGTISLVISVMTISTYMQICTQRTLLNSEYRHQLLFVKDKLMERGNAMAYHLSLQAEDALASYNLYTYIRQLEKAVADTKELHYAIVMDNAGMAHIHTLFPQLQETLLKNSEDLFAIDIKDFTTNEFTRNGQSLLEFITPLTVGTNIWGVLRLGYSLDNLKQIISDSQKKITHQTQQMIWRSVLIAVVFILISALLVTLYTTKMIKPLTDLAATARSLSAGKFSEAEKISIPTEDEIGILTTAFKEMAGQLKLSYNQLEDYSRTLEKKVEDRSAELILARDEALFATKSKTEFLARMSHEIRNPMNAILGMADLLGETSLNDEQHRYVQIFKNSGKTLMALINDILDLSKVEAGCIVLENIPFNLEKVAGKCCKLVAVKAHAKGLELVVNIRPGTPLKLTGDPARLRQVLLNLMDNALKFTDNGEIVLNIHPISDLERPVLSNNTSKSTSKVILQFSIRDTGMGIPRDQQDIVFEAFAQANTSIKHSYGGTGLGLSICRQLVHAMEGDIKLESPTHCGNGCTFIFTAHFHLEIHPSESIPKVPALTGQRVMIIDDNRSCGRMLQEMLTAWGAQVHWSETVSQGLSKIQKTVQEPPPFDIILMDGGIPWTNEVNPIEKIKKTLNPVPHIILMLTTVDTTDQIEKTRKNNVRSYLFKPIIPGVLIETILNFHEKNTRVPSVQQPVSKTTKNKISLPPLKILLAEDAEENQVIVKAYLRQQPCHIDIAENGDVAVKLFMEQPYDLILMDIQMPVMDGHEAIQTIRSWEKTNKMPATPIIALTAHAFESARQQCLEDGCNGYLTKPIKKTMLLKAIADIIL